MAAIDGYLQQIRTEVYGRDVRSAIANGIEECYGIVQAFDGIDLSIYAKKSDLNTYLTKTEAAQTYAGIEAMADYLTYDAASNTYATIASLQDYITEYIANDRFATKTQLNSYLKASEAELTYVKRLPEGSSYVTTNDLVSYSTTEQIEHNYVTKETAQNFVLYSDLDSYPTARYVEDTFVKFNDLLSYHSFDYVICEERSATTPQGAESRSGIVGTMPPTASTMHRIYLVLRRNTNGEENDQNNQYDAYITINPSENEYAWEKIGGGSSGQSINWEDYTIDLSNYITYAEAAQTYATQAMITGLLTESTAAETYVTKASLDAALSELTGNDGLATRDDLKLYLKISDAEEGYATRSALQAYVRAEDIENVYATKLYVDSQIITAPTGDNIMLMLEVDDIPGTTQTIIYNSDGDIERIIHVKDGNNYRVDSFVFGEDVITETRVLTTGQTLTISINTETSETVTTYSAT